MSTTTYRVVAETQNGFRVIGTRDTIAAARRLANQHIASLDPDTDECPEMAIEWRAPCGGRLWARVTA